ncbi:hypothetical protein [Yoonia sp. R2-816]|uniref:hypothetical protein n=1 Tax=Yoonia sp. R2-816 TaxID=3342638 RepID=UPI0037295B46
MLTDALETMLTGQAKPANQFSEALKQDKSALELLSRSDRKPGGKIAVPWQNMRIAKDVAGIGTEKVIRYLRRSAEELGEDRKREARIMAKTAKMIDVKDDTSAYDRSSMKELFGPLQIDRRTGKPIVDRQAARVRGTALAALAKLTPELRAEIRAWSASAPLPKVTRGYLSRIWGWRFIDGGVMLAMMDPGNGQGNPPSTPTPMSELRFNLHRVDCISDTDGGEMGADEIELGGTDTSGMENAPTDALIGTFGPVSAGDFRTGDDRTFSPPFVLNNWGLTGLDFPHTFLVNLLMSEKDANDRFVEILDDLAAASADDLSALITAVSAAAGAAAGAAIGGAIGTSVAPLIGSLIGLVVGALAGLVGAWVSGAVNPEVFENVRTLAVILDAPHESRDGSTSTPSETVTYVDHGGHYTVRCNFSLH